MGAKSAMTVETAVEKAETDARQGVDNLKAAGRDIREIKDKACQLVNGKLHCVGKKIANKTRTALEKTKTKAKKPKTK